VKKLPLFLLAAIPLWLVAYPPIQDLPNHLARIHVILDLLHGGAVFGHEYAIVWLPIPDLGADLVLLPLMSVLPAAVAGKLFLTGVMVLTGLALDSFFRSAGAPEAAWLALPLLWNWFVFMGFLSFLLSVALTLFAWAWWRRRDGLHGARDHLLFGLLATAVYFCHLASFAFLVAAVQIGKARRRGRWALFRLEPGFVPGFLLYATLAGFERHGSFWMSWPDSGNKVFLVANLWRWFRPGPDLLVAAAVLGAVAIAIRSVRRAWLAGAVALLAVFVVLPRGAMTGYWVDFRILPFAFVVLLASFRFDPARARIGGLAALALVTVWAGVETVRVGGPIGPMIRAASALPRQAKVLPLTEPTDFGTTSAWHHLVTWTVSTRDTFTPYLFAKPFQHPLRPLVSLPAPYEEWFSGRGAQPDPDRIARTWDFVWLTGDHPFEAEIRRRGTLFLRSGALRIYRFPRNR
jgi:hypothetical protein